SDDSTAAIDHFTKTYGDANPAFGVRYAGFVLGQGPGVLGGSLAFDTAATAKGLTSSNYDIHFVDGTLDIGKASLSVTVDSDDSTAAIDHFTKTYGDANPAFGVRYAGFVLGQGPGVLGGSLAFDTAATASSDVGAYAVTPKGLTSSNYDIHFVDGTLDIGKASLSVTVDSDDSTAAIDHFTKTYGDANPAFGVRYAGFVLGQGP